MTEIEALRGAGRGQAIVVSDGLSPDVLQDGVQRLRARGFRPRVLLVEPISELSSEATARGLAAGEVRLVDAESGHERRLGFSTAAADAALRQRSTALAQLVARLEGEGIACARAPAGLPFESAAQTWLRS